MFEKPASTDVPIAAPLARRWSGRAFDPDRPVPREVLLALCEAARWAPSCYGDEPIVHGSIHRTNHMLLRPFDHPDIYDEAEWRRREVDNSLCY